LPTAILIDGAYFLRRFSHTFPTLDAHSPEDVAYGVEHLAAYHIAIRLGPKPTLAALEAGAFLPNEHPQLYRIFFYDCPPLSKKVHQPVSKQSLDLASTPQAIFRNTVHERLRHVRKVALRLGRLNDSFDWKLTPDAIKRLTKTPEAFVVTDNDFALNVVQKGVDMRLGLDVASLAYKRQVDQIVLVAGDADFVPAAKLARREGIDVVIDPMWGQPARDLVEHCDGVRSSKMVGQHDAKVQQK
jgi:uncharacterized LabA/DUF88 family protein